MPKVNHQILSWARETAGLSLGEAAERLGMSGHSGASAADRLAVIESGAEEPTRALLVKMTHHYRRPLITFYMSAPPRKGDRGEDFRNLPHRETGVDVLVDALVRDIRARQSMVRAVLIDDEEAKPLSFIASLKVSDGISAALTSIRQVVPVELSEFRAHPSPEGAFAFLRSKVEAAGIFVLLMGNLGSHHTAIDVEAFRGFALADDVAPFVVLNDHDAPAAWSFTLLHELVHLWLGTTGVSGAFVGSEIEKFCNDVAGSFLLPADELPLVGVNLATDVETAAHRISEFAKGRNLSRSMIAYRLLRAGFLADDTWRTLAAQFKAQWLRHRDARRQRQKESSRPSYYVVRRHRLGPALLRFVSRSLGEGTLSPTKASRVLGVKLRGVTPLLSNVGRPGSLTV
jgi:Zn-dependent peptidase ImmA (M78 family)